MSNTEQVTIHCRYRKDTWLFTLKTALDKRVLNLNQPVGGRYIASEKQVKSSFNSSVLLQSYCGLAGGDVANPTPASLQIIPHC